MRHLTYLAALLATTTMGASFVGCSDSGADEATDDQADGLTATFSPVADSWVRSGTSVNSNKGGLTILYADAIDSGSAERRIFLKFSVSGISGKGIRGVTLRMTSVSGSDNAGAVRTVSATNWGEMTLTWNNQPA